MSTRQTLKTQKKNLISQEDTDKALLILESLTSFYDLRLPDGVDDILSVLVRSILSQATSTKNRNQAFSNLLGTFNGDWNNVRLAEPIEVEKSIKVGGLAKQKTKRIQNILEDVFIEFGECSLEALKKKEDVENFDYLSSFSGVGPQSAALTIMLGAKADICPVNTDVLRVLKRLDLLANESGMRAHRRVNSMFPKTRLKETHYALISHGRTHCVSRTPKCADCPLRFMCSFEI